MAFQKAILGMLVSIGLNEQMSNVAITLLNQHLKRLSDKEVIGLLDTLVDTVTSNADDIKAVYEKSLIHSEE